MSVSVDPIELEQEGVMAPRKTTAEAERNAARKTQEAHGDQVGLVALTTTLLAGAVTGAVAGLVEEANARHARHESSPPSPGEPADHKDDAKLEQAGHAPATSVGDAGAGSALRPSEAAAADTLPTTQAGAMVASRLQDAPDRPLPTADTDPSSADPAVSHTGSSLGDVVSPDVQTPAAKLSQDGTATASGGGIGDGRTDTIAGLDAISTPQTTQIKDDISAKLDHAIAGISEKLAERGAAIDATQIDIVSTLDNVGQTLAVSIDATIAQIDGQVARLTDAIDDIGASVTDAVASIGAGLDETLSKVSSSIDDLEPSFPTPPVAAIPATLLGADAEQKQPDGLLARLFDTGDDATSPLITVTQTSGLAEVVSGQAFDSTGRADEAPSAHGPAAFATPDLFGAIEAVKIGFAGQAYFDIPDDHGSGGSHANLLHGLL